MRLVVLALFALAAPAWAQLVEPSPEHYAVAYDSIAVGLALERLEQADQDSRAMAADLAELRRLLLLRAALRDARLDAHALAVQRWTGERVAYLPGTGWHEVTGQHVVRDGCSRSAACSAVQALADGRTRWAEVPR